MRKKIRLLLLTLILFALLLISLSPDLSLRAAVFLSTPDSAFLMEYTAIEQGKNYTLYKIDRHCPIDHGSGNPLYIWIVYRFGPFHFALWNGGP